jgi:hypothetical protein
MAENPTFADTERNGELIAQFLVEHHCEFTLENCRKAVQILSYRFDKLERQKPPARPAPPQPVVVEPTAPAEILEAGQILLNPPPSEWQLRRASKEAVKDYLKRARAQQQ